ncbi:MAG: 50S ribosomal protein L17 [Pseudomonadota bacterium]
MRHQVDGRTFGRRPEQRKALLRGLAGNLIDSERITTTVAKAKELRRVVEPLVTLAKRGDLPARRRAARVLYRGETLSKLFGELAERFKDRPGGYTRMYRIGQRVGDGAEEAIIELIPSEKGTKGKKEKTEAKPKVEAKTTSTSKEPKTAKKATKAAAPKKKKGAAKE